MREADFQAEIARSIDWLAEQLWLPVAYTKVPDVPRGAEHRFSVRKGYDAFLIVDGRHIALEYKLSKGTSIAFDALDGYQEQKLVEASLAGAAAFVLVNFRVTFSAREANRRGSDKMIAAFAVDIHDWQAWRATACRASAPLADWETRPGVLPIPKIQVGQTRQIGWDLRPLVAGNGAMVDADLFSKMKGDDT